MRTPEQIAKDRARFKRWYAKNRARRLAYTKQWKRENPEKVAAANRRKWLKQRATKNPAYRNKQAYNRKWQRANRKKCVEYSMRAIKKRKEVDPAFREYHRRHIRESCRRRRLRDPEGLRANKSRHRATNKAKATQSRYERHRRATNPQVRIAECLRARLAGLVRQAKVGKYKSAIKLLGCSIETFMDYLESKFEPGMSWENHGRYPGWQIDHIIPCSLFDLTKAEHQKRCFAFHNLQPLWAADNIRKSAKMPDGISIDQIPS